MADSNNHNSLPRFRIAPVFMFRWEESQQAFVLMYPEGIVKLNTTAGEILNRCNGLNTLSDIVLELSELFSEQPDFIEPRVRQFLEVCHGKGWIQSES
ncbi:pyrroloquinoline quinone biosynthesis peptide chaperone PqqD [Marinobacter profundi]|uniref:Pyrroloquinoline quinone biosynthesis peptide chaperone PqqD n=1 Tax=Marinobacter profundi TaxID=2666256 RepID=A0A2G1UMX2_9GAMM|nr:pyrroloquinoline quinone biosynthesis peptide chaperone PqqD [Marinobacter profundi]PHQ15844.1 pyrroloquinoline quinone biosynthesis peptide chaperone PqqD [Marinobacter profundi]